MDFLSFIMVHLLLLRKKCLIKILNGHSERFPRISFTSCLLYVFPSFVYLMGCPLFKFKKLQLLKLYGFPMLDWMVGEGGITEWSKLEFCCCDVTHAVESFFSFSFLSAGNSKTQFTEFLRRVHRWSLQYQPVIPSGCANGNHSWQRFHFTTVHCSCWFCGSC